jgi:thiamine pyrophosphokinase
MPVPAVILADGSFPSNEVPLGFLKNAQHLICCDGAVANLVRAGMEPEAIVGDLDSISPELAERFSDRLFRDIDQEINDLTKAVRWCSRKGYNEIVIVGATGKREDHTIGNISLLVDYSGEMDVIMVTDTGTFTPFLNSCIISSFPGQQVSIFSINPATPITSEGLRYELHGLKLHNWWRATLNEALSDSFKLKFSGGPLIVYQKFKD